MPDPNTNPYQPPASRTDHQTPLDRIKPLLVQSMHHRVLCLFFLLVYLAIIAVSMFLNNGPGWFQVILMNVLLVFTSWRLLSFEIAMSVRLALTAIAIVPIFNLLVIVVNHANLSSRAVALNIPVGLLGPIMVNTSDLKVKQDEMNGD